MNDNAKIKIGVIGAGDGASSIMKALRDDPDATVIGLSSRSPDRPAVDFAKELSIPVYSDYKTLADSDDVDLLIDATGSDEVIDYIENRKKSDSAFLAGKNAWFFWKMVEERDKRLLELTRNVEEQEILRHTGVMLSSAADMDQIFKLILESALKLTRMTAGSIAIYNEKSGEMQLKMSMGMEKTRIPEGYKWGVRQGGMTGHILSSEEPTVVDDLRDVTDFDQSVLLDMGLLSLLAAPLKVEGKIVGIIYVDDFAPREFSRRDVDIFQLLAIQAAAALDKALLLEKTERMALTDGLTKLYNYRFFARSLEREVKRAERYRDSLAMLMIDVDFFKQYNDTCGHAQGNIALSTLAKILVTTARETDVVARYGGEEFAIALVKTKEAQALHVAERIREEVELYPFRGEENLPGGKLTVSLGLAIYPQHGNSVSTLIEMADAALYKSKEAGRNQVTVCSLPTGNATS